MDYGHEQSDKRLKHLEDKIATHYKQAAKHLEKKTNNYLKKFKKADKEKKKAVKDGTLDNEEYMKWRVNKMLISDWSKDMVAALAKDMSNANQIATRMINNEAVDIYALNANYGAYEVSEGTGINLSFSLYDHSTVERLMRRNPNIIPKADVDIPKDERWNRSKMTSAITQGVLTGESIPKIASRLRDVTTMNYKASIRNARTYITAAENGGRVDSYKRAEELGIEMQKEWMSTPDGRTRDSHVELDGVRVNVDEEFPNGCEYPGDPGGAPEEIYNCRCTLVAAIKGYDNSRYTAKDWKEGTTYEQWKEQHDDAAHEEERLQAQKDDLEQKMNDINKTYSGIWKNDVTLADYEAKAGSIESKKEYYEEQLAILKSKDPSELMAHQLAKIDNFEQYLKDLKEFEKNGKLYAEYTKQLQDINARLREIRGTTSPFTADAYSELRKSLAKMFSDADPADKYYREWLDKHWDELSDREKYAVWEYTHNSNPMNQPLSGYNDGWSRDRFVGVGNANWGLQDNWRNVYSDEFVKKFAKEGTHNNVDYTRTISDLTKAIDKMTLNDDVWVVRGSDINGFAGLLEGNIFSFDDAKRILEDGGENVKKAFEGQTFQGHSFLSTGIASGTGFSGSVSYEIYAPKGTHAVYAEPASYFGDTINGEEIYKVGKSYRSVGGEAEVIFQRGTEYRITSIEETGYKRYTVKMEVVGQPEYFKTGLEETVDGGKTIHKN